MLAAPLLAAAALLAFAPEKKRVTYDENFSPGGWVIELSPTASICMPSAASKCKTSEGSTGPFVGGQVAFGYRPLRHIAIGLAYNGAALRPDWSFTNLDHAPINRTYSDYGVIHGVYAWGRPTLGFNRFDLGAELGVGWSYQQFNLDIPADTKITSNGLSLYFSPVFDVFVHPQIVIGIEAMFVLNPQTKVCVKGPGTKECRPRVKGEDQFPLHQIMPGLHFGFII